jgi:hypothetical protein
MVPTEPGQYSGSYNSKYRVSVIVGGEIYRWKELDDVISKKVLGQKLIHRRAEQIEIEKFSGNGWKPELPVEIFMNEIFHKILKRSFSYHFGC